MLAEEELIQRICSAGQAGVRKTDLRKEFPQPEIDTMLEKLTNDGQLYIDKKGAAYYCWLKEGYLQYLLNSDPRFRLTHEALYSLEQCIHKNTDRLALTLDEIGARSSPSEQLTALNDQQSSALNKPTIDSRMTGVGLDLFKDSFDNSINNFSSSIGWVELGKIRNDLCKQHHLDNEEFYDLVAQLISKYPDKYELSSGGYEGLTVRGLLHGFVRCI
ncbi:MAG TPA: hypothetical protein VFI73_13615 [Candidatus Nitrosopolaris sp.]|nr:hypothetical protein [Candidatus Nitrosopolaris sp.]